jgi:hypothetical protein
VAQLAQQEQAAAQIAIAKVPQDKTRSVGVRYIARGLSVMLLEPYPWNKTASPSFEMAKAEGIVWYPIIALALLGLGPAVRRFQVMLFPLLFGGGALLLYALTEGNVGTAFRHRGEFTWVIALLAGFGFVKMRSIVREIAQGRRENSLSTQNEVNRAIIDH